MAFNVRLKVSEREEYLPNIRLLGRFLLWDPNRNREQSVFLEKNSWWRVKMISNTTNKHVEDI